MKEMCTEPTELPVAHGGNVFPPSEMHKRKKINLCSSKLLQLLCFPLGCLLYGLCVIKMSRLSKAHQHTTHVSA
jgi:hypothetical protein